jgi:uncharacterized protein YndB with AHSA1/START domain
MSPNDREALTTPPPGSVLVIEREFDAPRERVWMAWTTPELVMRWWGPKGYTIPVCRISLRVGGSALVCMRSPEGKDYWSIGFYKEIVPYERIVTTDSFADEKGNVVPATAYGLGPDFPLEMLVTVTFDDGPGKTKLTLRHAGLPEGEHMKGAEQGWNESLDKLAALLSQA